jgi:uncharacterized protein (TIGR03083 family)
MNEENTHVNITSTPVSTIPPLSRHEAAAVAAIENRRFVELVNTLAPEDWSRPTDCPEWDVKAITCHVLGAMEGHVWLPRFIHQYRAGNKIAGDRPAIDGMTQIQVQERSSLTPREIVERLNRVASRAARARARIPGVMRRAPMKVEVDSVMETWRVGYLVDVILTRDTWMHRIDTSRATGRPLVLTADHDGRIVADVVAEWARRHGKPFALQLEGPAGGRFTTADPGEEITLDAIEFCRVVSGRASGTGLLTQGVPF